MKKGEKEVRRRGGGRGEHTKIGGVDRSKSGLGGLRAAPVPPPKKKRSLAPLNRGGLTLARTGKVTD